MVCAALIGCGGNEATKQVEPGSAPPNLAPSQGAAEQPKANEAPLDLALRMERSNDGIGLYVLNRSGQRVSLAKDVALEKKDGTAYRSVDAKALGLRFDCKTEGCVELVPGAELVAPSWLGRADGERCGELVNVREIGSYRFVVKSCGGTQQAAFEFEQSTPP
jgi:hypothetical protein